MGATHCPYICEVCNSEYEPTRNMDGTVRKTKHRTCSRYCYNKLRDHQVSVEAFCPACLSFYRRVPRQREYDGKFCSHACYAKHYQRIKAEVDALHSIGRARRKAIAQTWRAVVLPEIQALKRIARRVNDPAKTIDCLNCGKRARRLKPWFRFCSLSCRREQAAQHKRDARRTAKAKRRAKMRGAVADSIDPIAVFERDGWRCHLCKRKTKRSLRGTWQPMAPELDHIVSLSAGGQHVWSNVACACRECNHAKGAASVGQLGLNIPA